MVGGGLSSGGGECDAESKSFDWLGLALCDAVPGGKESKCINIYKNRFILRVTVR